MHIDFRLHFEDSSLFVGFFDTQGLHVSVTEEGAGRALEASRFCHRRGSGEEDTAHA
jgi:hypothetical protein